VLALVFVVAFKESAGKKIVNFSLWIARRVTKEPNNPESFGTKNFRFGIFFWRSIQNFESKSSLLN